jgi:hypothetical protein
VQDIDLLLQNTKKLKEQSQDHLNQPQTSLKSAEIVQQVGQKDHIL